MVVFGIIIIVILAVILTFFLRKEDTYSDNPKTWIEDKTLGVKEINVDKVTKGKGYVNYLGEQYKDGSIETVFSFDGIYKGEIFDNEYIDKSGKMLIKITNKLDPGDGIIDAQIIERIDNGIPTVFIFVDEDWKNSIGANTNIIWGKNYQNIEKFIFDEISEGVYMHKILDDLSRFDNNFKESSGGVLVGDITLDNVENNDLSDVILIRMI